MDPMNEGHVVTDGQEQYRDGEYTGAYAYSQEPMVPPRIVEPDTTSAPLLPALQPPRPPYLSHQSSFQDREEARVLTAQRVRAEDLAPRSPPQIEAGPSHRASSGSGLLESLGLGVLASIGRRSWFKQFDSPRNSGAYAYSPTYDAEPLSEKDIETALE
ncbi:hypothetical protein NLJ89_g12381 [Agrocybe chaxingu]|uniref:Uncharacterized protein n=1 Tax=Agrocybe chaxingu TaxID=84603 RepID=A0A9W8JNF2_9AGAR|nr:hypothetical protein NLJ89_g12381 [Agrocybe chaxingu]